MQSEAQQVATKLDGQSIIMIRRAGQTGQLYGSVNTRDIAAGLEEAGFHVLRSQIQLNEPIKKIGLHDITVALFADVNASVSVNVARSEDEAERQAMGEDVSVAGDSYDEEEIVEEDAPDLEEVFEEGAGETANEDDADADSDADAEGDVEDEDKTA